MITKAQLQAEFENLKTKLQELETQLNTYKEVTIENASPGDVLEDGSIVVKKENGLALLAAPASVEVNCQWSKDFPDVFTKLKDNGFNPSHWFIPTKKQLNLAYQNPEVRKHFASADYWSSTEFNATIACGQGFNNGDVFTGAKAITLYVRPFRCVVF
jgi:hypothetical protein